MKSLPPRNFPCSVFKVRRAVSAPLDSFPDTQIPDFHGEGTRVGAVLTPPSPSQTCSLPVTQRHFSKSGKSCLSTSFISWLTHFHFPSVSPCIFLALALALYLLPLHPHQDVPCPGLKDIFQSKTNHVSPNLFRFPTYRFSIFTVTALELSLELSCMWTQVVPCHGIKDIF